MVGTGEPRVESLRLADVFRARVVDSTNESFVFEVTGASSKVDAFIELMRPLGMVEMARTGVVGRGPRQGNIGGASLGATPGGRLRPSGI